MSLAGKGVVAIWQDLVPEARPDFYEWHNRQHVPERLGIPGFRRGRRFVAVEGGPEFYTLYEADTVAVVTGKDYLDRLNAPTDWSRRIMPTFRNMARSVCQVAYSASIGEGGFMATLRFSIAGVQGVARDAKIRQVSEQVLPPILQQLGVVGVHLCSADESASCINTFEKTFRQTEDITPQFVIMIEGTSYAYVQCAVRSVSDSLQALLPGEAIDAAVYQLQHSSSGNYSNGNSVSGAHGK